MNNTINPYETSSEQSSKPEPKKTDAFWIGARNGFLWSLFLAVPAAFIFYDESFLRAIKFDPVTFARTRVPITNAHRIGACLYAFVTAAGFIVLPWSLVAGIVKLVVANRNKDYLSQQGNEGEIT